MNAEEREQFARENGHPPSAHNVLCVDFDGTLRPWGGLFDDPEPLPGAVEFMVAAKAANYELVIFTSRLSMTWHLAEGRNPFHGGLEQMVYIEDWLTKHGIPFDHITAEKIPAMAYIDDKAVFYHDNWPELTERLT